MQHGLFSGGSSHLRQMPEHRYGKLKRAEIIYFYPTKSLLELANHVLETATSLECLTLDTSSCCCRWRRGSNPAMCYLEAIKRYFEGKIPSTSTVRLDVEGPCCGEGLDEHTPSVPFYVSFGKCLCESKGRKFPKRGSMWQGLTVFGGRS